MLRVTRPTGANSSNPASILATIPRFLVSLVERLTPTLAESLTASPLNTLRGKSNVTVPECPEAVENGIMAASRVSRKVEAKSKIENKKRDKDAFRHAAVIKKL